MIGNLLLHSEDIQTSLKITFPLNNTNRGGTAAKHARKHKVITGYSKSLLHLYWSTQEVLCKIDIANNCKLQIILKPFLCLCTKKYVKIMHVLLSTRI